MRSATISNLAFLASSLLVKDVFAGVVRRENYMVWVEEEVRISRGADGSLQTGAPVPFTTRTELITPSSAPTVQAVAVSSSAPAKVSAAVFAEEKKPSSAAAPQPKPTTTAEAPPPPPATHAAPTTLATAAKPTTAAAKPTTSAAAPPATVPSTSSGVKRGVAFNDNSVLSAFSGKASWCYNWGQYEGTIPSGIEYVPMLWGNKNGFYDSWSSNANKAISSGSTHLLAFNEPDLAAQSGMSVATAVADFKTHMQPFAGKAKLGGPSVTNGGAGMGLDYLGQFVAACSGCTIDFFPIHWYNGDALDQSVAYFKSHVAEAYTTGGKKPIWITEFQYTGGDEAAFLAQVLPWLESQDYVERYSYFMASEGRLVSGSGLTALGKSYVAV